MRKRSAFFRYQRAETLFEDERVWVDVLRFYFQTQACANA